MAALNPITTTLESGTYLVHPQVLGQIEQSVRPDAVIPVTLLSEDDVVSPDLDALLRALVARDDVLSEEFLRVLVTKPDKAAALAGRVGEGVAVHRVASATSDDDNDDGDDDDKVDVASLPSGPYFVVGGALHQAWRLHPDPLGAFVDGVVPASVTRPPAERADMVFIPTTMGIPVPSRLFFQTESTLGRDEDVLPLAGVRVALADGIALSGTAATLSSRAFTAVSEMDRASAARVRTGLLARGAVVVGRAKVGHLACASPDWVDVHMPFNPRGDGYLDIRAGAAGAVAAVAGYEWLDGGVAWDAAGGALISARDAGVWAVRETWDVDASDGARPDHPFDSLAPLARSPIVLERLAWSLSTAPSPSLTSPAPSKPSRLITLTNVFPATYPANDLTQSFIATLETHLGVSHTEIDVAELWTRTAPEGRDKSLVDWLADAPMSVLDHDFYNSLASFRERHAERFKPRLPYIEPRCRDQLRRGENVGKEDYTESLRRVGVFRDWFASQVLSKGSPEMAEAVVVVPVASADVEPRYRDERRPDADDGKGVAPGVLAAMLEAPLATVPFTTLTYPSPITGTDEQLPVSAGLIGPRGSESVLIRALEGSLRTAGARAVLSAGACVFGDEGLKDEQREALGQALSVGEDVAAAKMRIDIRIG